MYCVSEKEVSLRTYQDTYATLQETYPKWNAHELRLESATILRPRFQQDKATAEIENSGLPIYEVPQAMFTVSENGLVQYPNYGNGIGLVELSERSKRLMPEQYSPYEHATSLLIQNQFQEGARIAATSYGGRDIVIMEYNKITKEGKTTIVNTAVCKEAQGKTIQTFMKEYFPTLASIVVTEGVFLFSDKPLSLSRANEIIQPVLKDTFIIFQNQRSTLPQHNYRKEQKQDDAMAYIPLPFLSDRIVGEQAVAVVDVVSDMHNIPFATSKEIRHIEQPQRAMKHNRVENEKKKMSKESSVEAIEHFTVSQDMISSATIVFQYEKPHDEAVDSVYQVALHETVDSVPRKQKSDASVVDTMEVWTMKKEELRPSENYIERHVRIQKFLTHTSQAVMDEVQLIKEPHTDSIALLQQEESSEEDVVVQQTVEKYFKTGDKKESIVAVTSNEIRTLYLNRVQEEPLKQENAPKDVKKIRKLCWIPPLQSEVKQPEMLEVDMPKDRNQRLYNILHFLRKILKHQFGEDSIRVRQAGVVRADSQESTIDEIEYYLSLLERKHIQRHMFAMVS